MKTNFKKQLNNDDKSPNFIIQDNLTSHKRATSAQNLVSSNPQASVNTKPHNKMPGDDPNIKRGTQKSIKFHHFKRVTCGSTAKFEQFEKIEKIPDSLIGTQQKEFPNPSINKSINKECNKNLDKCIFCKNVGSLLDPGKKILFYKYEIITTNTYNANIVNDILFNTPSRIVALFKDYLILDDHTELIKKYYPIDETKKELKESCEFYSRYSKVFPNYVIHSLKKCMFKNITRKQKMIDERHNDLASDQKVKETNTNYQLFTKGFIEKIEDFSINSKMENIEIKSNVQINLEEILNKYLSQDSILKSKESRSIHLVDLNGSNTSYKELEGDNTEMIFQNNKPFYLQTIDTRNNANFTKSKNTKNNKNSKNTKNAKNRNSDLNVKKLEQNLYGTINSSTKISKADNFNFIAKNTRNLKYKTLTLSEKITKKIQESNKMSSKLLREINSLIPPSQKILGNSITPKCSIPKEFQNKLSTNTNIHKKGNLQAYSTGVPNESSTVNQYGNFSMNPSGSLVTTTNGSSNNNPNPFHININFNLMINPNKKFKISGNKNKNEIQMRPDPVKSDFYLLNTMNHKQVKLQKKRTDSMPRLNTFSTIPAPLISNNLYHTIRKDQKNHPLISPRNISIKTHLEEKKIARHFFKIKEKEDTKKNELINNHLALVVSSYRSNSTKKVASQKYEENRAYKSPSKKRGFVSYKSTTKLRPSTLKNN